MIEPRSYEEPKFKELISVLIEWINDELAGHRIIVKDLEEDLYDGQILQKLFGELFYILTKNGPGDSHNFPCLLISEKLTSEKLDVPEVTQSQEGQKSKLRIVLNTVNRVNYLNSFALSKPAIA